MMGVEGRKKHSLFKASTAVFNQLCVAGLEDDDIIALRSLVTPLYLLSSRLSQRVRTHEVTGNIPLFSLPFLPCALTEEVLREGSCCRKQ